MPTAHSCLVFPKPIALSIQCRLVFPPLPHSVEGAPEHPGATSPGGKEQPAPEPVAAEQAEMTWYPGMSENRPTTGGAVVIRSIAMATEATKLRTRGVLLVARNRPHMSTSPLET